MIIGVPCFLGGVLILVRIFLVRLELADGVLSASGLFDRRRSVRVSDITAIVPVQLTIQTSLSKRGGRVLYYDVRTAGGSSGIWLTPGAYGAAGVKSLLKRLPVEPSTQGSAPDNSLLVNGI